MISGKELKDIGQKKVLENNACFRDVALNELRRYLVMLSINKVEVFTFENFRQHYFREGFAPPSHHNAWGALASKAVKEGIIVWTGEYIPATSARTHGHPVKIWKSANG